MKKLILILAIFTSFQAFAEMKTFKKNNESYQLIEIDGVWVSKNCQKNPSCLALSAPTKGQQMNKAANPFAEFCQQSGAKYESVSDNLGLGEGLCIFKDKSYIIARDYFTKFKVKK